MLIHRSRHFGPWVGKMQIRKQQFAICILAATAVLMPAMLFAQTTATTFAELRLLVKTGDTVIVTDVNGETSRGRVIDLSPSTLVVRTRENKSFSESRVASIGRPDSAWNGALVGAGVGGALAILGTRSLRY